MKSGVVFYLTKGFMYINAQALDYSVDHGELKYFASFLHFKGYYSSGVVHNFSISKMARLAGITRKRAAKLINFFLKEDWCQVSGGNIRFKSTNKIYKDCGRKDRVEIILKNRSIKDILDQLHFALLFRRKARLEYCEMLQDKKKNGERLSNKEKVKAKKLGIGEVGQKEINRSEKSGFCIGFKKLAKTFGTSISGAHNIIKTLLDKGMIKLCKPDLKEVGDVLNTPDMFTQVSNIGWEKGFNEREYYSEKFLYLTRDGYFKLRGANTYYL